MKKICMYFLFVFLFGIFANANAAEMRIVVMNLKADGVSDRTARTVSNMLRTEFINMGEFIVVERSQMNAILKEQGLQQSGCTDQECAVQMGRLMSAKKILVGEVSPMGKSIINTVRIVDVEKGVSEYAATQKAASEEVLDTAVALIAKKLASRIRKSAGSSAVSTAVEEEEEPEIPGVLTPSGYYLRSIVPGWGQLYANHTIKGWVFLGVFGLSAFVTLANIGSYNDAKAEYEDLGQDASQEDFDTKYKEYEDAGNAAGAFAVITLGIYVIHWVDIFFFSKPDFSAQTGMLDKPGDTYFTFDTYRDPYNYNEQVYKAGYGMRF